MSYTAGVSDAGRAAARPEETRARRTAHVAIAEAAQGVFEDRIAACTAV